MVIGGVFDYQVAALFFFKEVVYNLIVGYIYQHSMVIPRSDEVFDVDFLPRHVFGWDGIGGKKK